MKRISLFIIVSLCLFVGMISLTGCSITKKAIDSATFDKKMEKLGYTISDISDQYSEYDYVKGVHLAVNSEKNFQIEFLEFTDVASSVKNFEDNKKKIDDSGDATVRSLIRGGNYMKLSKLVDDEYWVCSQVDNTVLFVHTSKDNKTLVKDAIKSIDY